MEFAKFSEIHWPCLANLHLAIFSDLHTTGIVSWQESSCGNVIKLKNIINGPISDLPIPAKRLASELCVEQYGQNHPSMN